MHALSRKARASVTAMQTESHQLSAIITTQTTRPSPESPDLPPPLPPPSLPPLTPLSAPDLHDPLNSAKNHTSSMNHSPRCQDRSSEAPNMPPSDGMASKEVDKHSKSNCRIRFKNSLLSSSFFSRRNKQLNLVQQSKEHENSNPTLRDPEGSVMLKTNTAKVTAFTNCSTEPTYADAATPPPKDSETLNELVTRPLNPSSLMMETLRRRYKEQIDTAQTVAENDVPREQLGIRRKTMPEQLPGKPMTPSPADDLNNDTDATPTPITEKSTGAEESIDKDVEFHDCESPTRGAALETPLPPIPVDIADEIQRGSAITFCDGINGEVFENIIGAIKPETDFPITSNDIIQSLSHIKNGATCTIAWTFDRQTKINISEGVVTKTNRRANKKMITLRCRGIKGHHASEYFDGFLPPQENVRIFHLRWHITPPELDESDEQSHEDTTFNSLGFNVSDWKGDDVDHLPIPTAKTISPDFIPRILAIYRDIMQPYHQSDYPKRNKIWNQVLSAMKLSLAEVRQSSVRQRRRRPLRDPFNDDKAEEEVVAKEDRRAIKRVTRLALEGCVSKACKVFDRSFQNKSLTDLQKLRDLHPEQNSKFDVPEDAPIIAAVSPIEIRSASKRLAKGVSPVPTGTTDSVIRLLVDDEPCCGSMCHMMGDLINGFLSRQVMQRLNRARLVAIAKPDGGVRPVAIGEIFGKLAGLILLQRYEKTLEPLFSPIQQGVFSQAGCERIVHKLRDRYRDGHTILSVDMRNAFNTPSRTEMAKSVFAFATLKPFQRFFTAEYSEPSDLLYFGSDGNLASIIPSSAGVRQGSALASLYFCVFCQPILETLAMEFPGVEINAYIDDITLVSRDPNELETVFFRLRDLLKQKRVSLAETKCVWFQGMSGNSIPWSLQQQGLKTESDAIKILGAHIGENESISERLLRQVNKHDDGFRRLKKMGINNISLLLLSKCVNIRLQYLMRVHEADTTDTATSELADCQHQRTTFFPKK